MFRKVDKVVRCFRPKANFRRIILTLQGPSFGTTFGPAIFELIPYAILDNAIKYAPNRSDIAVRVEDAAKEIYVSVVSYGPLIEETEREAIFAKGFRGKHAVALRPDGTGIGLHTTRELVRHHFSGDIAVSQTGDPTMIESRAYYSTQFEVVLPRK